MSDSYDIIIIGSGAGGGTLAHELVPSGKRILLLERGSSIPPRSYSPRELFLEKQLQTEELWLDRKGRRYRPGMHYYVGGNTKVFGAALVRMRPEDFKAAEYKAGKSPGWPITYDELEPWYARAERLYNVHRDDTRAGSGASSKDSLPPPIPHAPHIEELARQLRRQGLHPTHLPMGIDYASCARSLHLSGCDNHANCDGYPCKLGLKSDAEARAINPIKAAPTGNFTMRTGERALQLIADPSGREVRFVEVQDKEGKKHRYGADLFVVTCGAVNSAALLLRSNGSGHRGLANSTGLVGKNYMVHLNTALMAISRRLVPRGFQKTMLLDDFYLGGPQGQGPLGLAQTMGKVNPDMLRSLSQPWFLKHLPPRLLDYLCARSIDWWLLSEDFPREENCVTISSDGGIEVRYVPNNRTAHRQLVRVITRALKDAGYPLVLSRFMHTNCSHQVGTVRFGSDSRDSVLDGYCQAHEVRNLFVVDGSFFPSSAAVNPALTIMAQAMRVADYIQREIWRCATDAGAPSGA